MLPCPWREDLPADVSGSAACSLLKFKLGVTFWASTLENAAVWVMNGSYKNATWVSQAGSMKENLSFS